MSTKKTKLKWQSVRWRCDTSLLGFKSTSEIKPIDGIVGQDDAMEAIKFAIECDAYGQNAFVRGLSGTGRMSMLSKILNEVDPKVEEKQDHCYVANFRQPDRPNLISLKAGQAVDFRKSMDKLSRYIADDLEKTMNEESIQQQKNKIEEKVQAKVQKISDPFEKELDKNGLSLLSLNSQDGNRTLVAPVVDGKTLNPSQWEGLVNEGQISKSDASKKMELQQKYNKKMEELGREINQLRSAMFEQISELMQAHVKKLMAQQIEAVSTLFNNGKVDCFLNEIIEDVMDQFFFSRRKNYKPFDRYCVNVLLQQEQSNKCPVLVERTPSLQNLLGSIESKWGENGPILADHMSIRSGSLLEADGGFLILDTRDLLAEQGAWKILIRTIKSRLLEIIPAEMSWPFGQPSLKPEPIPVHIRVILLGDSNMYYALDAQDPDFPELFKVLADFDSVIDRDQQGFDNYAAIIAKIISDDNLLPFGSTAVGRLIEHGARICSRGNKLTAKFSRVADLAREADFLAKNRQDKLVLKKHVDLAIGRTKTRAGLSSRKFQEMLNDGTINIDTEGGVVGQINGLAVIHAGPIVYGFPSRITASIGPGRAGVINIEGQAGKSGSIHTKGFHILSGLLRYVLPMSHPLTFSASIAFEQSYGGIDGDSASGAEFCCLISALTQIPINQGYAMTGAIDQHGKLQASGGVNEKIEGYFDTCDKRGLTGKQGVIIPASNASELMLRSDVQQACKDNSFCVHAVSHISQAVEVLMGKPAGILTDNIYPVGTVFADAMKQATKYWQNTQSKTTD
ncbi:MAG: AAA family ATPase [Proteobacteria bacterium]|nr:AAA family ATPase [Pseudomonadota bacterium]